MPTNADEILVDTSVAVALVVADHDDHSAVIESLQGKGLGLAGHAAFETFSVLTRLPPPLRRTPRAVAQLLTTNFPRTQFLEPAATAALLERLPALGIAGGAVYDALVGATAVHHGTRLATRDRRALRTYQSLEVDMLVLS
jgi:predicted nucleic acid-binding protein